MGVKDASQKGLSSWILRIESGVMLGQSIVRQSI